MTKEQILGIVRHGLTFIGGILVIKGVTSDAAVQEVIGAALSLISIVWSVVSKKQAS